MGTRSLTVFQDADKKEIAVLYRQFDGYPSAHGKEIKDLLSGVRVVNGLRLDETHVANGAENMAVQVISHFGPATDGGFYLYPAGTRDCGEEYIYFIRPLGRPQTFGESGTRGVGINLEVIETYTGQTIYDGPVEKFPAKEIGG